MVDSILDSEQADPDIQLSEVGRIAKKSGGDGFSWSYIQGKHGMKRRGPKNSKYLIVCIATNFGSCLNIGFAIKKDFKIPKD
jgi:hypothetical protein